jgi:hypothetical protein
VFKKSTKYNESIETLATTLRPSSVGTKESTFRYVCNSLDKDSRIALLTSSTLVFLGARKLRYIKYMAFPNWRW